MTKKPSIDYWLILATVAILFVISAICVYGMFAFKIAQIQLVAPEVKARFMDAMNRAVSPFLIVLIMLLGICVPKRLLPVDWLARFAALLLAAAGVAWWLRDILAALQVILFVSACLQFVVLLLAIAGSERLHFEKKNYWVRVGSSAFHLGILLFVLDLFYYRHQGLHLLLFWVTTAATVAGMLCCFYAETVAGLIRGKAPVAPGE